MLHGGTRDLDPVGQYEAALELARRDPAMEEHALPVILGLLAAHDELLVLHGDRQVPSAKPATASVMRYAFSPRCSIL
jgi:hypothetical protein